jgi:hypothetical protein
MRYQDPFAPFASMTHFPVATFANLFTQSTSVDPLVCVSLGGVPSSQTLIVASVPLFQAAEVLPSRMGSDDWLELLDDWLELLDDLLELLDDLLELLDDWLELLDDWLELLDEDDCDEEELPQSRP